MKMESAIRFTDVSLELPTFIGSARLGGGIIDALHSLVTPPKRIFTEVMRDLSFEILRGERVALLGRNGAGKSTLLNMMCGTYPATSGTVEVHGEVSALLNVGLGFNYEATLIENIVLRASAMGQSLAFSRSIVDDVLDFAELRPLAHRRLSTLSAGQRMRLGFAISTQSQPEVLLLDEWIGTGDEQFIKKAKARMVDRVSAAGVVVLASHNVSLLRDVCNRGMLIEGGAVIFDGAIGDAIKEYSSRNHSEVAVVKQDLPVYSGRQKLSKGRFLGLDDMDLQKVFENASEGRYAATFLSPIEFPQLLSKVAVAMERERMWMRSAQGSTRIETFSFESDQVKLVLGLKAVKTMSAANGKVQIFQYHITLTER